MKIKISTDWKHVKRALLADGFSYANHITVGEFNKDDILILIDKKDPDELSYIAYMGEEPISLHTECGHRVFYKGGFSGPVQHIPGAEAPISFSWTVYVYLGASAHKGHGIPRSLARKEMGI